MTPEESRIYFDFSQALKVLKRGGRVSRKEWKHGQCVAYQPGYPDGIPCNEQTARTWGVQPGTSFKCRPYLQRKMRDGSFEMWTPGNSDIFAEDWFAVAIQ